MSHVAAEIDRRFAGGAEPWLTTWARRAVTVSVTAILSVATLAATPLWVPAALLFDLAHRGKRCAFRCGVFLLWYLACEAFGILASTALWLGAVATGQRGGERYFEWNFGLQCVWATALLRGAQRIFGFEIEVDEDEAIREPMLLMLRHASVADTVLAAVLIASQHDIRLRYVIKRDLLWDPCLDIVGNRLPNYFVRRGASDGDREVRGVQTLMHDLGPREGVLIYPEGTRFTPKKRAQILDRMRERGDTAGLARSEALHHTLPPRLGGTIALLDANPHLDAVFCAHTGFDAMKSFWDLWNGGLRGARVRLTFWRVPYAEIPVDRSARVEWLHEQWLRIDDWVGDHQAGD